LNERHLQVRMRMLVDASWELHLEYDSHLKAQKDGVQSMAKWSADRANGAWYKTLIDMGRNLLSPERVNRLRLTLPSAHCVFSVDDSPRFQDELVLLGEYKDLVLNLMANRAWSQCHYGLVFPYCLARILSSNQEQREKAKTLLKTLADGILKVEDRAMTASKSSTIKKLFNDIGTLEWVVTREVLIQGYKVSWDPRDQELRSMAFSMSAGPTSTKYALESTLSTVKDAGQRVAKNTQNMSSSSKWLYAATSPYPEQGGTTQIKVDHSDFFECQENFRTNRVANRKKVTNPYWEEGLTTFKEVIPSAGQINAEMRKAGYHSNKISAAAMAYVLKDAGRNFQNLQRVWSGQGI